MTDFTTPGFETIDESLVDTTRWHGAVPATHRPGEFWGIFEENFSGEIANIDRSAWQEISATQNAKQTDALTAQWHDQGLSSTCTCNAGCEGIENLAFQQLGLRLYLSPESCYQFCGSGPNSGSTVSCVVKQLMNVGALPYDDPDGRMRALLKKMDLPVEHALGTHHDWYYRNPSIGWPNANGDWTNTAGNFRLQEAYDVKTFSGFITALCLGFNVHYGRTGHSILARWFGYNNGQLFVKYQDSYNRYGYDTESYIVNNQGVYGAIAYRSIRLSDRLIKAAGLPALPN